MVYLCIKARNLMGRQMNERKKCVLMLLFVLHSTFFQISEVLAIQNTPTLSSKLSSSDVTLSASSFAADKTALSSSKGDPDNFESTQPAHHLQSSRSVDNLERNDVDSTFQLTSPDGGLADAGITASKRIEHIEENNIEVKPAEYYDISSTKNSDLSGEDQGAPQRQHVLLSEPQQAIGSFRQRQGRQEAPRIYSDRVVLPSMQTATVANRQANPDIQDIITGIVKLLNGNVNVAANTNRPHKHVQATRINNRGPPRISDLPPLPPDFDTLGMNPPPLPLDEPYPFEKPPAPERPTVNQLPPERPVSLPGKPFTTVGSLELENRPWHRPYHRPSSNRRPIPPYKPLPPADTENSDASSTSRPADVSSNHSYDEESGGNKQKRPATVVEESITKKPTKYQPPLKQDKVVADNTLILGSKLQPITIPTHADSPEKPVMPSQSTQSSVIPLKIDKPTNVDENQAISSSRNATMTTLRVETSSSIQVIESTPTIEAQPSIIPTESSQTNVTMSVPPTQPPTVLESSRVPDEPTSGIDHVSTPTDALPTTLPTRPPSVTESSVHPTPSSPFSKATATSSYYPYRPRPGIVLDDTLDFSRVPGLATQRPYAPPRRPQPGDIFDVTVSAIQGPGGGNGESVRVSVNPAGGASEVILTSAVDGQGFVSIDGQRTYLNLFDNTHQGVSPTKTQTQVTRTQGPALIGTGHAVPQFDTTSVPQRASGPPRRPTFHRRPTQPPVRIDTCIVGDTSTCDASQHEACATMQGVSACHCKPGYARLVHTLPCKRVVSIVVSIRVDRIYDWKVVWSADLENKDSESYQSIVYESNKAIDSAMSMTPFSDEFMGSSINGVYQGDVSKGQGGIFVNATLKLTYESRTSRPSLAGELQRHLLGVIHRRNNNIGSSAVFVDAPVGSISSLQDLDECASSELNDCNSSALCVNTWGGFTCTCKPGFKDPHKEDASAAGRTCLSCPPSHCNNRGTCSYQGNAMQCSCTGNNYGAQCEIDGEVLGVAIGASVAAAIIIILTLVCLVMWSRRWSREQKAVGSPMYGWQGGMPGTLPGTLARVGSMGTLASVKQGPPPGNIPPYLWGHIADRMATANLYGTEPMGPTRPSSAVFGYPTMSCHGTLPPVPLPRLQAPPRARQRHQPDPDSSDSEPQDRDRADLIPHSSGFHAPRPKSRSSLANQSGIYYDVEYDQGDAQHLSKNNIPMSTYSMARPYYRT